MRTKALILFFPFAVFLAETASFIPAMKEACTIKATKKSACTKEKKENACSSKNEKQGCTKGEQDGCSNKDSNKTPADKSCTDNAGCSTCPVCYTFIFQQQYEWAARHFKLKKNYTVINTGHISSYTNDVWKPPNGFLYTS